MYQQPPAPPPPPPKNSAMKPLILGCVAVLVLFVVVGGVALWFTMRAIGGALHTASDVAQVARGAAESAQQAAQPGSSANPDQAAAAGVAALKSLVNGGKKHVDTLSRDDLKQYLPAAVGSLARSNTDSSSGAIGGITGTNASASYGDSNSGTLQVEITDAANMMGLTAMMDLMMGAVQNENDEGYEKTTDLQGIKVHEKWQNSGKHAELIGVVGGRFVISVTSNGLDIGTAEQAFQAVDIGKLSAIAASTPE